MNKINFNLIMLLAVALCNNAFSQSKKDTVYFDEDWSVCEKPVAEYYRVAELNRDSVLYYKGDVKDYYINGQLEMTGDYGQDGNKNGEFIFYNKKGIIIKKGNYLNNVMMGDWFFYDSLGKLRSQFFCKTQLDFTPVLLIDNNNDTTVKNGTGEFSLNNVTDYPYIRSRFGAIIKGNVHNGVKDGEFKYYNYPKKQLVYSEKYEDGRFVKSKVMDQYYQGWIRDRFFMMSLSDENLEKIEGFYHSNMVFGIGFLGNKQLTDFLQYNLQPRISDVFSLDEKDKLCYNIIFKVLMDDIIKDSIDLITADTEDGNKSETLSTSAITQQQLNTLKKLNGDIQLTVDTTGEIADCIFNTNLTKDEEHKIDYYLKHISGLPVAIEDKQRVTRTLHIKLNTIITNQNNNMYVLSYVLSNAHAYVPPEVANVNDSTIYANGNVEKEASYPGGYSSWNIYLLHHLNGQVAAQNNAPNGNYTVTVSFIVDVDGTISDIKADNDPGYGTAIEAVRVIKKGPSKWIPAIKYGKNVKYRQKEKITFIVNEQ